MTEKTCMFQYGTNQRMLADTDLITQEEALMLFSKNKDDFMERLQKDENPEMAVWINCRGTGDYANTLYLWCADDFLVVDGELYQRV